MRRCQNRISQRQRFLSLLRDELVARERRGRGHNVEAEGDERVLAFRRNRNILVVEVQQAEFRRE